MPASIFKDATTAKVLRPNLDLNGTCSVLQGSADPTAVAQNAPAGSLYLMSTGRVFKKMDAGSTTNWQEVGSGFAGKNYITQSDAEGAIGTWVTYTNTAQATPVTGVGGSPSHITLTASGTTPLRGQKSFLISNSGSTSAQGEGVSYPFTIDPADQAKVISVTFDYKVASGTFVSGNSSDIQVYIYDVTNGQVIQLAPYTLQGGASNYWSFKGVFQTASNSQSYRLIFHCATANTAAWGLEIDNVVVGPQNVAYGAAVMDRKSDNAAFSFTNFGTVANSNIFSQRVGDCLVVTGYFQGGTPVASAADITLSGYAIDSSKLGTGASRLAVGKWVGLRGASSAANISSGDNWGNIFFDGSTTNKLFFSRTETSGAFDKYNGSGVIDTSGYVSIEFEIPVLGWSSTVLMSNDTDTRVVAMQASGSPSSGTIASALTSSTAVTLPTVGLDTHGAYSSGIYTIPVAGVYQLDFTTSVVATFGANSQVLVQFYSGSTALGQPAQVTTGGSASTVCGASGKYSGQFKAGDLITVRVASNGTTPTFNGAFSSLNIARLSGPAAIAATETVACRYTTSGGSISDGTTLPLSTKDFDTHGAVTSNIFTAPISGKYQVKAVAQIASATLSTAQFFNLSLLKNGTTTVSTGANATGTGGSVPYGASLTDTVSLLAGETVQIKYNSNASAQTLSSSTGANHVAIERVGN